MQHVERGGPWHHLKRRARSELILVRRRGLSIFIASSGSKALLGCEDAADFLRLPDWLEREISRALYAETEETWKDGVYIRIHDLLIVATLLCGPDEDCIALSVERWRVRNPVESATRRFGLSPREAEVLSRLIEGADKEELCSAMHISGATVAEYFKRLHVKIGSRSRTEMMARVFHHER